MYMTNYTACKDWFHAYCANFFHFSTKGRLDLEWDWRVYVINIMLNIVRVYNYTIEI